MKYDSPRILFLGTPEISAFVLRGMILAGYNIVGVVAQPDKPIGRKGEITLVPTKKVAQEFGIPVFQPIKIRNDYAFATSLKPDLIICFAYGQIVPQTLLDIPTRGSLNLHGSLLPKYRGASPMQYALINGDKVTGVTLMQMIDRMDAGLMYAKKEVAISPEDNLSLLSIKIARAALELILAKLPDYMAGRLVGIAQDDRDVTFAGLIKKDQEHLDITLNKDRFVGWVRALSEEPGGFLSYNGAPLKIYEAEVYNDEILAPIGTIISADKEGIILQLADGQVNLLRLQKPGKRVLNFRDFINGEKHMTGAILS